MDVLRPVEHELTLVGILAGGADSRPAEQLRAEDFSDAAAARIFKACRAISARRETVNFGALDAELTRMHGAQAATQLMNKVMTAVTQARLQGWRLPQLAETISEAAQRRALVQLGRRLSEGAANPQGDMTALSDGVRAALRENSRSRGGWIRATDACLEAYEAAENSVRPIPTGVTELDKILCGGLHRGELTILGARPAVGKSAVLLQMALTAARSGAKVCFISLEMSAAQIGARVLAANSSLNAGILRTGVKLPDTAWADLAEALALVGNDGTERLTILPRGGMTVEELRAEVQNVADRDGCDLLVVDYLQLLRTKQRTGNDFERLGIVSRALKALTLDLDIPIVAAAQVRRQNNSGIPRAPGLDELRGSGDIEQDGDNVILLHRPEFPEDPVLQIKSYTNSHAGLFEFASANGLQLVTLEVAKQRQGATARAWTLFDPAHMRFIEPGKAAK